MKRDDLIKYHQQSIADLQAEIGKLTGEFTEARLRQSQGQLKNIHTAANLRHNIARLKTIIRHKELTGDTAPAPVAKPVARKTAKKTTVKEK